MDTTQLLKGVLDVAVLAAIQDEDGYGYDVVRRLRSAGLDDVGDASVYGTLRRLYSAGALTSYVVPSDDGPHRKYYGINAQGTAMLREQRESWSAFASTMSALLAPKSSAKSTPTTPASVRTTSAPTRTTPASPRTTPAPVRTIGEK